MIRFSVQFPYGFSGMNRIDTKRGGDGLRPRREPYWYKLSTGRYLGLRKLSDGHSSWVARIRAEEGGQSYRALGENTELFEFDQAKVAAETWFRDVERGVSGRNEDGTEATVRTACIAYVRALRKEGRAEAAHDAHMRFRRTVYGTTADSELETDEGAAGRSTKSSEPKQGESKGPEPHLISRTALAKIRGARLRDWHLDLTAKGLSKASANRTLTALKAALNLAIRDRRVSGEIAQELADVVPLKGASKRRDLFLDVAQRRALLVAAQGGVRDLMEAAMCTGCRAGELTSARRSAFDARTATLNVSGKTGGRSIPLAAPAVALFARLARDKLPTAFLLTRNDGKPWAHSDWDELVKEAAATAELPKETCLYTLRHSFITQVLLDGMSTLEVAKMVGTSLAMIEKHYGHLVQSTARERLAKVQLL